MSSKVFSREWWSAAGTRAANTAIAGAIPYVTLILSGDQSPTYALSATAALALASFLTSLAGIPEVAGKTVSLGYAIATRTLKTFGQSAAVWVGGSIIVQEYDWTTFAIVVGAPVLITFLRTVKEYLPETAPLVIADATQVIPVPGEGTAVSVTAATAPVAPDPTKE